MKLFGRVALAALVASGVTATAGTAASGTTLHLIERDNAFTFVPIGPHQGRAAKPGDEMAFSASLFTPRKQRAGRVNVACVATTGGTNPVLQCTGTFTLAGGAIVGSALIRGNGNAPTRIAILGGTGAYEGARGSILSVPSRSNHNVAYDTVRLLG